MTRATIHVPRPCAETWEAMTPTAQGRHCSACQHTVTDFTQRTDAEILALLRQAAGGRVCGRFRAEQLDRELVHAPAAASRWRAWLLTAAALWGVPAAAQSLRTTHPGGPVPTGGNAPTTQQSAPTGVLDRPAKGPDMGKGFKLGEPTLEQVAETEKRITGQVVEAGTKLPLAGVTILLKGTTTGTSTNAEGRFALTVAPEASTILEAYFIGYQRAEIRQTAPNQPLRIELREDDRPMMGEVVIVKSAYSRPWYTPRGLWHRLRAVPRRLTGRW